MFMNQKPASASHDLLIVQRDEQLPPRVHEALQRKGFAFRLTSDPAAALSMLAEMVEPILIVECGQKPGIRDYLSQFISNEALHDYPLLVLGKEVDGLGDFLANAFGLAVTVKHPCTPQDLLEAINYIARVYRRERAITKERPRPVDIPTQPTSRPWSPESGEDEEQPATVHELYSKLPSIPHLLFEQLQSYNLTGRSLGGGHYPKLLRESSLQSDRLLPIDPTLKTAIDGVLEQSGKWASLHLLRMAFMTERMLEPLGYQPDFIETVRSASFLWPYAFTANRILMRKLYTGRGSALLRKELCSLIKDSALQLTVNLQCTPEAEVVALIGRLIGREEMVNDNASSIGASAVMAADIADRACFQGDAWNPRAAYGLIVRIKDGRFRDAHPAILCCLVKFLSEAITEGPQDMLLSRAVRTDETLKAAAQRNKDQVIEPNEQKVPIAALTPGMKLSRPLFAFDGQKVLSEDLILDQDLIWRIWQLSALRPLNAPVVVLSKMNTADEAPPEE